jgi:hypothetical protein
MQEEFNQEIAEIALSPMKIEITTRSGHVIELGPHHMDSFCKAMAEGTKIKTMRARFHPCEGCGDRK